MKHLFFKGLPLAAVLALAQSPDAIAFTLDGGFNALDGTVNTLSFDGANYEVGIFDYDDGLLPLLADQPWFGSNVGTQEQPRSLFAETIARQALSLALADGVLPEAVNRNFVTEINAVFAEGIDPDQGPGWFAGESRFSRFFPISPLPGFTFPPITSTTTASSFNLKIEQDRSLNRLVLAKPDPGPVPEAVPSPAMLPGLIGMGFATFRKRRAEAG